MLYRFTPYCQISIILLFWDSELSEISIFSQVLQVSRIALLCVFLMVFVFLLIISCLFSTLHVSKDRSLRVFCQTKIRGSKWDSQIGGLARTWIWVGCSLPGQMQWTEGWHCRGLPSTPLTWWSPPGRRPRRGRGGWWPAPWCCCSAGPWRWGRSWGREGPCSRTSLLSSSANPPSSSSFLFFSLSISRLLTEEPLNRQCFFLTHLVVG